MGHEVRQATEVGSKLPISYKLKLRFQIYTYNSLNWISLVLHENKIEDAVEDSVYQICESKIEDEKVGNGSHSLVSCNINPS